MRDLRLLIDRLNASHITIEGDAEVYDLLKAATLDLENEEQLAVEREREAVNAD